MGWNRRRCSRRIVVWGLLLCLVFSLFDDDNCAWMNVVCYFGGWSAIILLACHFLYLLGGGEKKEVSS